MSNGGDGAHMGVGAERALKTILGDDPQPEKAEQRTPDEMRIWILSAMPGVPSEPFSYDDACRWTARQILEQFLADPSLASTPIETEYDWPTIRADARYINSQGSEGVEVMREHVLRRGLMDVLKDRGVIFESGLTGFQWGWACNAARFCVELPPVRNPAFL